MSIEEMRRRTLVEWVDLFVYVIQDTDRLTDNIKLNYTPLSPSYRTARMKVVVGKRRTV